MDFGLNERVDAGGAISPSSIFLHVIMLYIEIHVINNFDFK